MALSGFFTGSYRGYTYRISWQGSQSIPENCTRISCTHELVCASGYDLYINSARTHSVSVGNSTVTFTTSSLSTDGGETITLGKTSHTLYHSEDGSCSFSLSAKFSMKATISGVYVDGITVTGTAEFDTIARASSISVPDGTLGVKQQITVSKYSDSFRHSLTYEAGEYSGALLSPDDSLTTVSWTPYYALAENAAEGEYVAVTFTLTTFSDSTATSVIGKEETVARYRIPQNLYTLPDVSVITETNNGGLPDELSNLYIQGLTKVRILMSEKAKEGATIESRKITFDGKQYDTTAVVTPPLSGWGTLTVSASVTDSRGFVGTAERTVTVLPYSKPYPIPADGESMIKCLRATDNGVEDSGGERLRVKIKKGFSPLTSGGTDRNRGVLSYRHKPASTPASDYGAWVTLLDEYEGNTFDGIIPGLKLDPSTGHSIQFRVSDLTGNSNIITLSVQSEAVTLHLAEGGEGLAVGMYSSSGGFEVGFDSHFYGDVHGRALGMGGVPFLPDGTDLNDCREFGVYAVINNEKAKTMLNIPIAEAGTLRVWSGLGISKNNGTWVYIVQDYVNFTGRKRYSRYLFTMDDASVWTVADWIEI